MFRKYSPPAHIAFNRQKILEANSPWCTRSGLEHEAAELGMEHRRSLVSSVSQLVQMQHKIQRAILLWFSYSQIRHTSTLFEKFRITRKSREDIRLSE